MKKITTVKKFGLTVTTLLICIAMLVTCFTFAGPFGASRLAHADEDTRVNSTLFDGVAVQSECDYGDSFTVPVVSGATVTVTKPDGNDIADLGTADGGKYTVKAAYLGNYVVKYTASDMSYSFNVNVTLDKEYFLKVADNGADIPTYIQKGDTFKIPDAKVVYYDDNNILNDYPGKIDLTVSDSYGKNDYKPGDTFAANTNGKVYLTYSARLDGESGNKYFNKTFTINVQTKFEDSLAPSITVSGVPSDVSVNRSVTLPKATATDNNDENIKIVIEVTDPNGNKVRKTDINEYGYAYQDKAKLDADVKADADKDDSAVRTYPVVEFDNDKAMVFYPVMEGQHKVSYQAFDDKGNTSTRREFTINVSDLAAPVIREVAEHLIPETWGLTVKKANPVKGGAAVNVEDTTIRFKVPEVVDNKDHAYAQGEDDADLISLYFRITDADNSRTIVEFTNILAPNGEDGKASADATFKGNSTYGAKKTGESDKDQYEEYVFNKDNDFVFDLSLYNKTDKAGDKAALTGSYTVLFRARDKSNNTSSKTYTITVNDEYVDDAIPTTAEVPVPAYIAENEDSFDVPSPIVADASDSRLYVVYRIYSNNGEDLKENGRYITVDGGEKAEFTLENGDRYLYINKGETYEKKLKLGTDMYFYVSATDKVGNFRSNVVDADGNFIDVTADGNEEKYADSEAVVKVITPNANAKLDYASEINFGSAEIKTGDTVKAGGFTVTTTEDMRYYTGFEVSVYDPLGNTLKDVRLETFSAVSGSDAVIYVKNIEFKASVGGNHYLVVRALNVNGKSVVNAYPFSVTKKTSSGTDTSAASSIGTTGEVNKTYKLHNDVIKNIGEQGNNYTVVRKISGGVFALIGNEITVKSNVSYYVTDGYMDVSKINGYQSFEDTATQYGKKYSVSVTDSATPVIEVLGVMPTYAPKYDSSKPETLITLPTVVAYTENGAAVVDIKITDKDSKEITPTENEDGSYSFKGEKDGVYTVIYTATYANATPVTAEYKINVGDVVGPEFKYVGGTQGRMTIGDTFTFGNLELTDANESKTGVTITKKLIDPSKSEVSSATVNGSFNSNWDKKNNGTDIELNMGGVYEVVYTVTDPVGNSTTLRYTINVTGSGSTSSSSMTVLSTVLIVVAVVLLAGVIVYVVRFRKVKK